MKSGRVTVILLALTIVLALAVPTLREAFTDRATQILSPTHGNYPSASRLAEIAAEHPADARLWYGYALAGTREEPPMTVGDVRQAFERAISLAPGDPAPRLSLALFEMDQASLERLPQEEPRENESRAEPTAEQLGRVRRARELLEDVRDLDPDNAVPDYLLAWTWLAEGEVDRAPKAASRGAAKEGWTAYTGERAEALLALIDRTDVPGEFVPMAAISLKTYQTHSLATRLRSMARAFRNTGDGFRARGEHDAAIRSYEVCLRAGHLMRTQAHDLIDGLVAVAISTIAVSSDDWAPPNDDELLEADPDLRKSTFRVQQFTEYLRRHGRPDLADFAEVEIAESHRWRERAVELPAQMMSELVEDISGGTTLNAGAIWGTAGAMLLLALLVAVLSLLARYWREPRTRVGWSHLQWLALLALLAMPGQAGAWIAMRRFVSQGAEAGNTAMSIVIAGVALGIVLWALGVLVLALRKRRSLPAEERLGGPRTFLRGLRALICPTLAALILLCMPATLAIEHNFNAMAAKHRQLAIEGEVAYYDLQADAQAVQSEASDAEGG